MPWQRRSRAVRHVPAPGRQSQCPGCSLCGRRHQERQRGRIGGRWGDLQRSDACGCGPTHRRGDRGGRRLRAEPARSVGRGWNGRTGRPKGAVPPGSGHARLGPDRPPGRAVCLAHLAPQEKRPDLVERLRPGHLDLPVLRAGHHLAPLVGADAEGYRRSAPSGRRPDRFRAVDGHAGRRNRRPDLATEDGPDLMAGDLVFRRELQFYDENIPCLAACPVHTNAGMYVAAIADGDDELAYLTARLPNPFASVCGRVCAAPCEDACRRGEIDRPIAIRALKRFVTEQFGPETENGEVWKKVAAPPGEERRESVGIVGGGPAGLSAAHDLRRLGYQVTVYEATRQLGGMMLLGIPEYRLDRTLLTNEIEVILDLGVNVHLNTKLGDDITLIELREKHDAVFVAIGATLGRGLDIEGHDADGVLRAIEFLINANQGFAVDVGERVVVIGGGDVAMDAARTALRAAEYEQKALGIYEHAEEP